MNRNYAIFILFFSLLVGNMSSQTACSGAPAANTAVISATQICQGTSVTLSLTNAYSNTGILFQWVYSTTSNVGPWSLINGANSAVLTTNTLTLPGWYTCVILCSNSLMTTTATSVPLLFGSTTMTSSVPYAEGFQVTANNQLPNCSWAASSLGNNCLTFSNAPACSSGSGVGAFSYSNTGTNAFYSNGIQLYAGVVYSIALWARTNVINSNNWTNLSIAMGPNQNATGTTTLITNNNVGSFATCTNLGTTFTVPSTGIYYTGIYGTSAVGTTTAQYLFFDDLSITIPCTGPGAPNSPTVTCSPATPTSCSGSPITLTLSGADLYNGSPNNVLTFTLNASSLLTIVGANTLTGCISTKTIPVVVTPMPNIFVLATPPSVCPGGSATIISIGAPQGATMVVTPTISTIYSISTGTAPCIATNTILITVNPLPTISVTASGTDICEGEVVTISSQGALIYQYGTVAGLSTYTYAPATNTTLLVTGIDNKGCMDTENISFKVNACLGLKELSQSSKHYYLYPNPTSGIVTVLSKGNLFNLTVFDYTGKELISKKIAELKTELDLSLYAKGLYFLRLESEGNTEYMQLLVQ